MIKTQVKTLLNQIPQVNPYGEKVTLVAAIKFRTPDEINEAVSAGINDIGDNRVQEFTQKYEFIKGNPKRHFIGRLQTNKIKYLLGKVDLYHSVDRYELAKALSEKGKTAGVESNILLEVNIGGEDSKGGFAPEEVFEAYKKISALPALKIKGLMAMLPISDDADYLKGLAAHMRGIYDNLRANDKEIEYLSMGMSGDWRICIEAGSNMIRLGTAIFGERPAPQNK